VFEKKNVDRLSKYRSNNFSIDLQKDTSAPFRPFYGLFELKIEALQTYLTQNLEKGCCKQLSSKTCVATD
jgi:hypothetical protein